MRRQRTDLGVRAKPGTSLTLDEMRERVPSIFAEHPHDSRSDRYVYVPTHAVVSTLMENGFLPVEARASRSHDEDRRSFGKHLIKFRPDTTEKLRKVGDVSYEILLKNAHDGRSSYQMMAGLYRLVCLNGAVVSDRDVGSIIIPHRGNANDQLDQVIDGAFDILDMSSRVLEAPRRWSKINLSEHDQLAFAEAARAIRFHKESPIEARQLLFARRPDDEGNDLWSCFNRVQENIIRGGLTARVGRRRFTTREVRGIDGDVKINKALWELAASFAGNV